MGLYATPQDVRAACALYATPAPDDATAEHLLALAARDVERFLGTGYADTLDDLTDAQRDALRDATATQAAFRAEMGPLMLGADDNIASTGNVSFSLRPLPRMSIDAAERLSGLGLIVRAPMASDPVVSIDPA
jgi:hypothetical protein